jgi:hypothetical protein
MKTSRSYWVLRNSCDRLGKTPGPRREPLPYRSFVGRRHGLVWDLVMYRSVDLALELCWTADDLIRLSVLFVPPHTQI